MEAFGVRILPRTPGCGEYFFHVQGRDPQANFLAVDAIPISYQIPRRIPIGERLDDLLGCPGRGGMLRHVEMQHLAATVFQYDEHEQHLHGDRRRRKEIDRHQLTEVVVKKRLPSLSRWPAKCSEDSGHRALGDLDAEHRQFAVNSRRPPQRIGSHHPFDQPPNLERGPRSAASSAVQPGQACPELAKALPLPPDDRIGLHVAQRNVPAVPDHGQSNPEEAIEASQHRSLPFSLEGRELKSESGVLHRDGPMTAHQESNESKDAQKEAWHVSRFFAFILFQVNLLQADGIMANHSMPMRNSAPNEA